MKVYLYRQRDGLYDAQADTIKALVETEFSLSVEELSVKPGEDASHALAGFPQFIFEEDNGISGFASILVQDEDNYFLLIYPNSVVVDTPAETVGGASGVTVAKVDTAYDSYKTNIVDPATRERLITKYASKFVNPVVQGSMETAEDFVVQMMHHFINGTTPTSEQVNKWNAFYSTCEGNFKLLLENALQSDFNGMNTLKGQARAAEQAMYNDPDWPT